MQNAKEKEKEKEIVKGESSRLAGTKNVTYLQTHNTTRNTQENR